MYLLNVPSARLGIGRGKMKFLFKFGLESSYDCFIPKHYIDLRGIFYSPALGDRCLGEKLTFTSKKVLRRSKDVVVLVGVSESTWVTEVQGLMF